jgi:hypothetical protein
MWDFLLVLGRVPGTNFVITFSEVIGFCLYLPFAWLAWKQLLTFNLRRSTRLIITYASTRKGQQLRLPV